MSGTTRDAVDTEVVDAEGRKFNLIDTAGIRKRSAVTDSADGAEPLSVQRAIQAVRRAQVGVSPIVLCVSLHAQVEKSNFRQHQLPVPLHSHVEQALRLI